MDLGRAGNRTRTGDLLHGKQTLYQLSYARVCNSDYPENAERSRVDPAPPTPCTAPRQVRRRAKRRQMLAVRALGRQPAPFAAHP